MAVRFAYEYIPFYRRKFDAIGLNSGDIHSVDDLALIPVTTKLEMAEDLAEHSPWGTYTALVHRKPSESNTQFTYVLLAGVHADEMETICTG